MKDAVPARRIRVVAIAAVLFGTGCDSKDACDPVAACLGPEPLPSPGMVVFQSNRTGVTEVYTMNADGTNVMRLTNNPAIDGGARWTPDGTRIVFSSQRGTAREIWIMNADGSDPRQLTNLGLASNMPDMSPDGSRVAFHAPRGDGEWDIYIMNADGTEVRAITSANSYLRPRWSPDGLKLLVQYAESTAACTCAGVFPICPCDSRVGVINPDGSGLQLLPVFGREAAYGEWSPDGRHIVFTSLFSAPGETQRWQLVIMHADGSGGRSLTRGALDEWSPAWSASTGRIFFVRRFSIYSVRPDGSDVRRLSATSGSDVIVHSR
jgi:Tol biopolymer transport system component